jgi:flagellar hook-associated protein 3 FlgL
LIQNMSRISENQYVSTLVYNIGRNKRKLDEYGQQISSGVAVTKPSDSNNSAIIVDLQNQVTRTSSHLQRIEKVRSTLVTQEGILSNATDIIVRAKELASQMSNEVHSVESRSSAAIEVWALRNQLVDIANTKLEGRFIYGGIDNDDPPFDAETTTYTTYGSAESQKRFVFDNYDEPPTISPTDRQTQIADTQYITVSSAGNEVFGDSIESLEKLARALEGYETDIPNNNFAQFTQPQDYNLQTNVIRETIDELENSRTTQLQPQITSLGERQKRLDFAKSLQELTNESAKSYLSSLQDTDIPEAATQLSLAQSALEASYNVTNRLLNISILDYL